MLFSVTGEDKTRSIGCKLHQGKFRLKIRKNFLSMRVVKHWKRIPEEIVESPSLEILNRSFDRHVKYQPSSLAKSHAWSWCVVLDHTHNNSALDQACRQLDM